MALKIIKGLFAIVALVKGFAGSAAKFADEFGIGGMALGALYNTV